MNSPSFRRHLNELRFWKYTDWTTMVDNPADLIQAVHNTFTNPTLHIEKQMNLISDLYPYKGSSAVRAAAMISKYLKEKQHALQNT